MLLRGVAGVTIVDLVAQTVQSASAACGLIGAGRPVAIGEDLRRVDLVILAVPDDVLSALAGGSALDRAIGAGSVVLHCSGALGAEVLAPLRRFGAVVASAHPVFSFSDPEGLAKDVFNNGPEAAGLSAARSNSFTGAFCALEGDPDGVAVARAVFEGIGARCFEISGEAKLLYHAATVMASNYLTALVECAAQSAEQAGVGRERAMMVLEPLVRGTVESIFSLGTAKALTGPIARGDHGLVAAQLTAIKAWNPERGELYRALGREALWLARSDRRASDELLELVARSLEGEGDLKKA